MRRDATILAATSELPWPLDTGGHLRTFHLLSRLSRAFPVRVVAGVRRDQAPLLERARDAGLDVVPAWLPPRSPVAEAVRVAGAVITREPYALYRRHRRPQMAAALRAEIARRRPALLYCDHLDAFQFASLAPQVPAVVDLHNVYSLLVHRAAAESGRSWPLRLALRRDARRLAQVEATAVQRAQAVFAVSDEERAHFAALGTTPVHVVPNGVDCARYAALPTGRPAAPPRVLFIGTLSWAPNVAAVQFLAHTVLPALRREMPDVELVLVGHNPGAVVRALGSLPGVRVASSVPDVMPYLREARMLAVPLEAGGGTRLKIIEAFAAGLPVVSTPIGCEGLQAVDGRHLAVAASGSPFTAAVARLLRHPQEGTALAANARQLARDHYDWDAVGARARLAIESLLAHA